MKPVFAALLNSQNLTSFERFAAYGTFVLCLASFEKVFICEVRFALALLDHSGRGSVKMKVGFLCEEGELFCIESSVSRMRLLCILSLPLVQAKCIDVGC